MSEQMKALSMGTAPGNPVEGHEASPPDWKQDQVETSRLQPKAPVADAVREKQRKIIDEWTGDVLKRGFASSWHYGELMDALAALSPAPLAIAWFAKHPLRDKPTVYFSEVDARRDTLGAADANGRPMAYQPLYAAAQPVVVDAAGVVDVALSAWRREYDAANNDMDNIGRTLVLDKLQAKIDAAEFISALLSRQSVKP